MSRVNVIDDLARLLPATYDDNSGYGAHVRSGGIQICKEIRVTGTGSITANILQFSKSIIIMGQFAEITSVTTLTNATNVYATAYDGTNSVDLTANGAVLSGAPVGSFFTKDKIASQVYTVNLADQVRLAEATDAKKAGRPFILTAKNGVDNFIRFHLTTTDAPVDFTALVVFEYRPLDGGSLAFV